MKILLLHDYGTLVGGAERSVLMLRDGLRERGHHVRLMASDRTRPDEGPQHGDILCRGANNDRAAAALRVANLSAYTTLRRELSDFRPDIVHARMFLTQLSPLVLPLLENVPTIHHVSWYRAICPRGTKLLPTGKTCTVDAGLACLRNRCVTTQSWPLDMAQLGLYRRWHRNIDATVAISQTVARRLEQAGLGPATVIENAVAETPPRPPLRGTPRLCYAGRLVPEKGVDVLLEAVAQIDGSSVHLDVAGTGPHQSALVEKCEHLGLGDRVTWHGHLRGQALQDVLDRAWVQVMANLWEEPFGNAVTEAMARGTAVVASDIGGPSEIVGHGTTGALVPAGDASALALTLAELIDDPDRCERLGAAGRDLARSRFSVNRLLDDCERLYAQLGDR